MSLETGPVNAGRGTMDALVTDLERLVEDSPELRAEMLTAMRRLWNCADADRVASDLKHFKGNSQARMVLDAAHWLFCCQDVADWPRKGRQRPLQVIERALSPRNTDRLPTAPSA